MLTEPIYSFIVTLAWILGKPLTLLFDPYESVTLFLAGKAVHCMTIKLALTPSISTYSELRSARWEIKLAGRDDSDVYEKFFLLSSINLTDGTIGIGLYFILGVTFWFYTPCMISYPVFWDVA